MCPPAKAQGGPYPNTDLEPYETMLKTMNDPVNHPTHYKKGGIETIDVLQAKLTPEEFQGYCIGNALKYLTRRNYKGKPFEDMQKAHWYLSRALSCLDGSGQQNPPAFVVVPDVSEEMEQVIKAACQPSRECIQPGCVEFRCGDRLYCASHHLSTGKSGEQGGPDGK